MKIIDNTAYNLPVIPGYGNGKKGIVIHYLGVVGQNNNIERSPGREGCGAQYYIYWDGTIYQAASDDAIVYQVGTAGGVYTQKHPYLNNNNVIGIEMCVKCDGDQSRADSNWYFTRETQEACVELVKHLMKKYNIPAANVVRHYDIVNKVCPAPYVYNRKYKTSWTWDEFKARLQGGGNSVTLTFNQVKIGDNNKYVLTMQELLYAKGYYKGGLDGSFGNQTHAAVTKYQKAKGLSVDGVCGPQTWTALMGM